MVAAKDKLILVVDDEEDVRNYFAALLEDAGFSVLKAADGERALEMVKLDKPDLISLDLVMPEKSGARLLYALRKNREWQKIPILIVTGHAHDNLGQEDLTDILATRSITGPQTLLEKPVSPVGYVDAVRRQLGIEEEIGVMGSTVHDEVEELLKKADGATMETVLRLLRAGTSGAPVAQTRSRLPLSERPARILVIDDETDVANYLAAILSDAGLMTMTANDPTDALEKAQTDPPDLITMDVDMPGMSGVRLYRKMMAIDVLKDVPVIVVTGIQDDLTSIFQGRKGMPDVAGYIRKPFDPAVLLKTVQDILAS
jgi:CheY-like chemotaxis protein